MALRRTGLLLALTAACAVAGVACGNASLSVFNPTTPTPACYTKTPPTCTFSVDVIGVFGLPNPAQSGTACYEGGCHSGTSPQSQMALGPPNAVPPSQVWAFLVAGSGGAEQRGGQGKDIVVSSTASVAATSMILQKPDQDLPTFSHTGGKLWHETSPEYKTILGWITAGANNN